MTGSNENDNAPRYCSMPEPKPIELPPGISGERERAIITTAKKWTNGSTLTYYFFDDEENDGQTVFFTNGSQEWRTWVGAPDQVDKVREGFQAWKDLGIGLEFAEVNDRNQAMIRIGFMRGDGSWSYLGTDVLDYGPNQRTMNLGWRLEGANADTAIHEIGHTLGLPHEHQNPYAGIVWNEQAVIDALAQPPNRWSEEKTRWNILRKIHPDDVQGSSWDPHSVMHYPFGSGLILQPEDYRNGLNPRPGLSERDKTWIRQFYPPIDQGDFIDLEPFESYPLLIESGQQVNFRIRPRQSRDYQIQTFGQSDTFMELYEEEEDSHPRFLAEDNDSGEERNARLELRLLRDRNYTLRLRLNYTEAVGNTAVMLW